LDKHITLFMGLLDERSGTLRYSVAGHHPLPVLYQGGTAAPISVARSSLPIGLLPEAEYFDEELVLAPDFALLLFSDGILEIIRQQGMAAKEAYLSQVVQDCKGDFVAVKDCLNVNKSITVPDDIAVMSVSYSV